LKSLRRLGRRDRERIKVAIDTLPEGDVKLLRGGLAVHIGARVSALAAPGEIVVSSTVKELVIGSGMQFTDRGEHELKGVPGAWCLYALGEERAPRVQLDGAAGYMRHSDRLAVSLARRIPRTMRLGARIVSRDGGPT